VVPVAGSADFFRPSAAPSTDRKDISNLPMEGRNVMEAPSSGDKELVDKFRASEKGSRARGILPVRISFPALGPSLYLVAELTSENQSPSAELNYQQDKKAGGK
jgi:hypothetical protein